MDTAIPTHISPAELAARMGSPDAPLLLDVRRPARFADSTHMLASARWYAPDAVASLVLEGPPREMVVYCVHGHELSQQAAATLRQAGWNARFLSGGFDGGEPGVDTPQEIAAWRAVRPLALRKRPDLGVDGVRASTWITRERPKIDRVACPWLVRRFIDPQRGRSSTCRSGPGAARRLRSGCMPWPTTFPGAPISARGRAVQLRCAAGRRLACRPTRPSAALARIVRGADTDQPAAGAAGRRACWPCRWGFRQLHASDDLGDACGRHAPVRRTLRLVPQRCGRAGQTESHRWAPDRLKATQP